MTPVVPHADDAAAASLTQSIAQIKANVATYGITLEEASALSDKASAFSSHLAEVTAQRAAAAATTARKDAARSALEKDYRNLVARIHLNPAVTDEHKAAAGIPVRDTIRTVAAPPIPTGVTVGQEAGQVQLVVWSRNGADPGTLWIVAAKHPTDAEYAIVGVSKKQAFVHTGQKPGTPILYRVKAQRGPLESAWSDAGGLYLD